MPAQVSGKSSVVSYLIMMLLPGLQVDGKSSVACYLMALDKCYASLCEKFERCRSKFERQRRLVRSSSGSAKGSTGAVSAFTLSCTFLGHAGFKQTLHVMHQRADMPDN